MARLLEHPLSLIVLILVVVVLLGWKRLPEAARSLGRSARILRSEADELKRESEERKVLHGEKEKIGEGTPGKE